MASHVTPGAILDSDNVDNATHAHTQDFPGISREFPTMFHIEFTTPVVEEVPEVVVYSDCIRGSCTCCHYIGNVPAQLKPCRAAPFLFGDGAIESIPHDDRMYLWKGLVCGFDIVDPECPAAYTCSNYDSILSAEFRQEMTDLLVKEISEHKVSIVDSAPRCIHSLGAVVKANGKLRPITDCSRPDGSAINNYMESTFKSFSYNTVEDAVTLLDPGDFMAVVDISSAYRAVSINPDHVEFQGLSWDFGNGAQYLVDRRLCFGLRCAPNIFDAISTLIVEVSRARGAHRVINYLDDFLIMAPSHDECLRQRDIVASTIRHLGFGVSWSKVTPPSQVTTFLGITIDSVKMELSLPMEKVKKLQDLLLTLLNRGHATKKELECVGGLVSHCAYIVRGGRTFSRRIFDLSASYSRRSRRIPLSSEITADFEWWLAFCHVFNGRACMVRDLHPVPIVSDSSFCGFGAWAGLDWLAGFWKPEDIPSAFNGGCSHMMDPPLFDKPAKNINVYELWPVVAGIHRWAPLYRNSCIHIVTDNMQVLAMINTGRSTNRMCMTWLREVFWTCFVNNIDLYATYIKSCDNVLADALSRAAYPGVLAKCSTLLADLNMCCSSVSREISSSPKDPPEASTTCSIRPLD